MIAALKPAAKKPRPTTIEGDFNGHVAAWRKHRTLLGMKRRFPTGPHLFDEHVRDWQLNNLAKAALALRMSKFRKQPPVDPARLNRDEQKRLARLEDDLIAAKTINEKREIRDKIMKIQDDRRAHAESAKQAADIAETTALEAARGSPVAFETIIRAEYAVDKDGARIIKNGKAILEIKKITRLRIAQRDGLEALTKFRKNKAGRIVAIPVLSKTLHAALIQYRKNYEDLDPLKGLRPPRLDGDVVSGGGGGKDWATELVKKRDEMERIEKKIQAIDPTYQGPGALRPINKIGRAVHTLREVAGKGNSIVSLGRGDAQRLNRDALVLAAEIVADHYGLQ